LGPSQWYELRLEGSAGTRGDLTGNTQEGVAIATSGRLCSIASGDARRFESEEQAGEYLAKITIPGNYRFEVVLCESRPAA
jgi:hypothetical protein